MIGDLHLLFWNWNINVLSIVGALVLYLGVSIARCAFRKKEAVHVGIQLEKIYVFGRGESKSSI